MSAQYDEMINKVWLACVGELEEGKDLSGVSIHKSQHNKNHEQGWEIIVSDKLLSDKHHKQDDKYYYVMSRISLKNKLESEKQQ